MVVRDDSGVTHAFGPLIIGGTREMGGWNDGETTCGRRCWVPRRRVGKHPTGSMMVSDDGPVTCLTCLAEATTP